MRNDELGLQDDPFRITPDEKFLVMNGSLGAKLTALFLRIIGRDGLAFLVGEPGIGKTMLLRQLKQKLQDSNCLVFSSPQPWMAFDDLLESLCRQARLPDTLHKRAERLRRLGELLGGQAAAGGAAALLLDEAEDLTEDVVRHLHLLADLQSADGWLLQCVVVGQPGIEARFAAAGLSQMQGGPFRVELERLTAAEVGSYIAHRLRVAGYRGGGDLFTPKAVDLVATCTQGVPRLINVLCSTALVGMTYDQQHVITSETVAEAARACALQLDATGTGPAVAGTSGTEHRRTPPLGRPAATAAPPAIAKPAALVEVGGVEIGGPPDIQSDRDGAAAEPRSATGREGAGRRRSGWIWAARAGAVGLAGLAGYLIWMPDRVAIEALLPEAVLEWVDAPTAIAGRAAYSEEASPAGEALPDRQPILVVGESRGPQGRPLPLRIVAIPPAGQESAGLAIAVTGLPDGARLSAGRDRGGGRWIMTRRDLAGLTLIPPPGFTGTLDLTVEAAMREGAPDADIARATLRTEIVPEPPAPKPAEAPGAEAPGAEAGEAVAAPAGDAAGDRSAESGDGAVTGTVAAPAVAATGPARDQEADRVSGPEADNVSGPATEAAVAAEGVLDGDGVASAEPVAPAAAAPAETGDPAAATPVVAVPVSGDQASGDDASGDRADAAAAPAEPDLSPVADLAPPTPLPGAPLPEAPVSAAPVSEAGAPEAVAAEAATPEAMAAVPVPDDPAPSAAETASDAAGAVWPGAPDLDWLEARGDALLSSGDIVSARLFFEMAAGRGSLRSMTAVGRSYDPVHFAEAGLRGLAPDPDRAAEWYRRAAAAGDQEAAERLAALDAWRRRP